MKSPNIGRADEGWAGGVAGTRLWRAVLSTIGETGWKGGRGEWDEDGRGVGRG